MEDKLLGNELFNLENNLREQTNKNIEEFFNKFKEIGIKKVIKHRHICQFELEDRIDAPLKHKITADDRCEEYLQSIGEKQDMFYSACDKCKYMKTLYFDEKGELLCVC